MAREEQKKNLCRHMTSYGECTLTEEPCVQGPCSLEEPEEWVPVVRCAACRHRTEPKCNKAEYAARGIAKCDNTKSPCYGRLVYLTEFCSHGERKKAPQGWRCVVVEGV